MKKLDCLGMRCPVPIIKVGKELKETTVGDSILLLADDPSTETDFKAWARMTGNQIKVISTNEFLVTKSKVD